MNEQAAQFIPMVDVQGQYRHLATEIEPLVLEVLAGGRYILGPHVEAFETETAAWLEVDHAVSCASGTDALHLALRAAGVGPGDEVITSSFTFAASAEAICYTGARVVFADIEADTWNLDPDAVARALGPATRALLPVHLFGQCCDMDRLGALASRHGLAVVEDCAQAFGATWAGRHAGTMGDAGAFSFFPSKNLGAAGDGGLMSTGSGAFAESLKVLRNHGSRRRYYHDVLGYNSRLDELQAAILRVKLRHLRTFNDNRRRVAEWYRDQLRDLPGLTLPVAAPQAHHVYHQFTILVADRDALAAALQRQAIASAIYYPLPLHRQPAFADAVTGAGGLPVCERVASRCLSLPMFPEMTKAQVQRIANVIRDTLA